MTKITMMPVVASGWISGEISARRLSSAPGSGWRTSTGTGVSGAGEFVLSVGPDGRGAEASFGLSSSLLRSFSMSDARSSVVLPAFASRNDWIF